MGRSGSLFYGVFEWRVEHWGARRVDHRRGSLGAHEMLSGGGDFGLFRLGFRRGLFGVLRNEAKLLIASIFL